MQFIAGDLVLWQRPIDGIVSFPATAEDMTSIANATAYRADGAILATANATTMQQGSLAVDAAEPRVDAEAASSAIDLFDGAESNALDAFAECVPVSTAATSTVGTTVEEAAPIRALYAELPPGEQGEAIWLECLATAQIVFNNSVGERSSVSNSEVLSTAPVDSMATATDSTTAS